MARNLLCCPKCIFEGLFSHIFFLTKEKGFLLSGPYLLVKLIEGVIIGES
jgi:hypothetical protein